MARTCGLCGAVSGGIMAVGMFYGRKLPEDSVDKTYESVRALIEVFTKKFGTTNCKELTGCDLGTDEGQNHFKSNNIIEKCKIFTEEATRIAMTLIEQGPAKLAP